MRSFLPFLLGLHAAFLCGQPSPAPVATKPEPLSLEYAIPLSPGLPGVLDLDFSQVKIALQPPAPRYPTLAKLAHIQGTVVVELVVGTDGIPTSACALGGPPQLRPTAENYAMGWKFVPVVRDGKAQRVRFRIVMPFKLHTTSPSRNAVLEVHLDAPGLGLDSARLVQRAASGLATWGVAPIEPDKADPAVADSVDLHLRAERSLGQDLFLCEARLRVSLLKDAMAVANPPGQPQQVWHHRAAMAIRGPANYEEVLAGLMKEVIQGHYAKPGEDLTMRYASNQGQQPVVVQPRVLSQTPPLVAPQGVTLTGPVTVRLQLDSKGLPRTAQLVSGPPEVEGPALDYAMALTCGPLQVDGVARPGVLVVTVPFL